MTTPATERDENSGLRWVGWTGVTVAVFPLLIAMAGWHDGKVRQLEIGLGMTVFLLAIGTSNLLVLRLVNSPDRLVNDSVRSQLASLSPSKHVIARVRLHDGQVYDGVVIVFDRITRVGRHAANLPFKPAEIASVLSVKDLEST